MSDTPVVGKIEFSSVANPNTWDIGESKCLVFASPSEAKRAEELFSAMQRELAAALAKLAEVEAERDALKARLEIDSAHPYDGIDCRDQTIKLLEERVDALKEDAERYRQELLDMAEYGVRFDMSPTVCWSNEDDLHWFYISYIRRIDESIRERAHAAIDAERKK